MLFDHRTLALSKATSTCAASTCVHSVSLPPASTCVTATHLHTCHLHPLWTVIHAASAHASTPCHSPLPPAMSPPATSIFIASTHAICTALHAQALSEQSWCPLYPCPKASPICPVFHIGGSVGEVRSQTDGTQSGPDQTLRSRSLSRIFPKIPDRLVSGLGIPILPETVSDPVWTGVMKHTFPHHSLPACLASNAPFRLSNHVSSFDSIPTRLRFGSGPSKPSRRP